MLLQTGLVAALGVAGFAALPVDATLLTKNAVMPLLAAVLFGTRLGGGRARSRRTSMTGVLLGTLSAHS